MTETKKFAQCGQEKPIEDFSKSYKNLCKACVAENERLKRSMRVSTEQPWGYPFNASVIQVDDCSPRFVPHPRFIASVAAMQGLLAGGIKRGVVSRALELADALINELNKTKR